MTDDLIRLRSWTAQRLRAGLVQDRSWTKHVTLLEAIDAVLHDIALSESPAHRTNHRRVGRGEQPRSRATTH